MLYKYKYVIKSQEKLSYHMSSLFQGALMERLPEEIAADLHVSKLHPYSQHLEMNEDHWYWVVSLMNDQMKDIFLDAFAEEDSIRIKNDEIAVSLSGRSKTEMKDSELTNLFYNGKERFYNIRFLTATAFKRQGKYLIYPDPFCIFQSLMNRHDSVSDTELFDEDALRDLSEHAEIVRYKLKSTLFHLEGTKIPSFLGTITIKVNGTATMSNLASMLLHFGEYSGVGIKTAIGMGAMELFNQYEIKKNKGGDVAWKTDN